jgi:hypothetical protein
MKKDMVPPVKDHVFILERVKTHFVALNRENNAMCWPTAVARVLSEMLMTSSKEKAAEFRRQAAICFEVAQRISLKEEQERMMQVAEHWLELAKRAEAEVD